VSQSGEKVKTQRNVKEEGNITIQMQIGDEGNI
jgi:hypothetical protein